MNNIKKPPLLLLFITFLLVSCYLFILSDGPFFDFIRLKSVDSMFQLRSKWRPPLQHLRELVIVGVDDESCYKMDRVWPWSRDVYAIFLDHMAVLGPKVIGMDFSFIGKSQNPKVDEWFAESLKENRNVILPAHFSPDGLYIMPLDTFAASVKGYGFIDKLIDSDSVCRRALAMMTLDVSQGTVYSFGVQVAYASLGLAPAENVEVKNHRLFFSYPQSTEPARKKEEVPIDSRGRMWLSYRYGYKDFTYIPYWKIIADKVPKREIEGKIVLVGPVSDLFHDIHPTPIGRMPGVCLTANEILAILDHDFLRPLFGESERPMLLVLTLFLVFLFQYFESSRKFFVFLVSEALIYAGSLGLFFFKNRILEPFSPLFVAALAYAGSVLHERLRIFLERMALQESMGMDGLTGLRSVNYFSLKLRSEFQRRRRAGHEFCVAHLDVDGLGEVNRSYGHEKGNAVLIFLAQTLKSGLRNYDTAVRYGEDQFALVISGSSETGALQCLARIKSMVEEHAFGSPEGNFKVTLSGGLCGGNRTEIRSADALNLCAIQALSRAKSEGKGRVYSYSPTSSLKSA